MEYKGVSIGMPKLIDKLLWKTFKKTFLRDTETGVLRGWNIKMKQAGIEGPFEPKTRRDGTAKTFGHYVVQSAAGRKMPRPWDQALLLDYSIAGNVWWSASARARAPLVAVNEGSNDLLLGWEFMQIGPIQIPTSSFFSLERDCPLTNRLVPPRPPRRQLTK
jgi:hypothetical protein